MVAVNGKWERTQDTPENREKYEVICKAVEAERARLSMGPWDFPGPYPELSCIHFGEGPNLFNCKLVPCHPLRFDELVAEDLSHSHGENAMGWIPLRYQDILDLAYEEAVKPEPGRYTPRRAADWLDRLDHIETA